MDWTIQTVAVPTDSGVCNEREAHVFGALCVHRNIPDTAWVIAHVGTGLAIPRVRYDDLDDAKAGCERISKLTNWDHAGKLLATGAMPEEMRKGLALAVRDAA